MADKYEFARRLDVWLDARLRAQHEGSQPGGRGHQAACDPEGQVVAIGQGGRGGLVLRDQAVAPRRGNDYTTDWAWVMADATAATAPIVILFFFT